MGLIVRSLQTCMGAFCRIWWLAKAFFMMEEKPRRIRESTAKRWKTTFIHSFNWLIQLGFLNICLSYCYDFPFIWRMLDYIISINNVFICRGKHIFWYLFYTGSVCIQQSYLCLNSPSVVMNWAGACLFFFPQAPLSPCHSLRCELILDKLLQMLQIDPTARQRFQI